MQTFDDGSESLLNSMNDSLQTKEEVVAFVEKLLNKKGSILLSITIMSPEKSAASCARIVTIALSEDTEIQIYYGEWPTTCQELPDGLSQNKKGP